MKTTGDNTRGKYLHHSSETLAGFDIVQEFPFPVGDQ
jgi:hypothetical protein